MTDFFIFLGGFLIFLGGFIVGCLFTLFITSVDEPKD